MKTPSDTRIGEARWASRQYVVLDAPSNLGLRPPGPGQEPGVRLLPDALRRRRLLQRIDAADGGRVEPPSYTDAPDRRTGFRNGPAIGAYTCALADRAGAHLDTGAFPVLLGGDCSIVLGPLLALRRRARFGLAFVDGHDDYSVIRDVERHWGTLTAAGLDLGLATGHGSAALTDIDGLKPYVREADTVHLGLSREPTDDRDYSTESFAESEIHAIEAPLIRREGVGTAARLAAERLERDDLRGFWVHLDADVLDRSVMPAVDSPNPAGLSPDELRDLLAHLLASPGCVGMDVCIYDSSLDPDGTAGDLLTDVLVAGVTG